MAIVAGIDEAGYGPLLGPMVISGAAFRVPEEAATGDLWKFFRTSVTAQSSKARDRLRVTDSKLLHRGEGGLTALERNLLPFLMQLGPMPPTVRALLHGVRLRDDLSDLDGYPWYQSADPALPRAADAEALPRAAERLKAGLDRAGGEFCWARLDLLDAAEFSREVVASDNKSAPGGRCVAALLVELWDRFGEEGLHVRVDKQGGRNYYDEFLLANFYGCTLVAHCQGAEESRYTLRDGKRRMEIAFEPAADSRHMPVALASMLSKYTREVLVEMLNAFWLQRVPGLRPTAGYVEDGRRFLADIESARAAEGIPLELLRRCR